MHRQELGQINKALRALPVKLRECIVLRELEELSYKDIARITGAPIGTVMSRLSRARQAMSKATVASSANRRLPLCPCKISASVMACSPKADPF
jgi:DNA-directed RNA polymerase specialized sigma24 family protein